MPSLNIRDAPPDLVREAKAQATLEGIHSREWFIKVIEEKLKKKK